MPEVVRASLEDVGPLAAMLARAFEGDGVAQFIFPDQRRRERWLEPFFALQLRHLYLPYGEVYTTPERNSVAMWIGPRPVMPRGIDSLANLSLVPMLGRRILPTRRLARFLAAHHPAEPHYYLATLGTDPPVRARGLASSLLVPVIERCDASGLCAYLECSSKATIVFYQRFGFSVREEVETPSNGPRLWLMRRDAPGRGSAAS